MTVKFRVFTPRATDFDYRMIAKIYKTKLMMQVMSRIKWKDDLFR